MSKLDTVRTMIQENDLETASQALVTYLNSVGSRHKNEAMLHAAAISRVKENKRRQIISVREANEEQSRICNSILDLLEIVEKESTSKPPFEQINSNIDNKTPLVSNGIKTVASTRSKHSTKLRSQQFNLQRLRQLEYILKLQYEKLHEFEKALIIADGISQKISLRMQMKHELTPDLRKYEKEYAELLASETPTESIPSNDAETIVAELKDATLDVDRYRNVEAPEIMISLLEEIKQKLNEPGKSAAAKLKVTLPIIPMIASYDLELDTENFLVNVWHKARDLFENLVRKKPS